MPLEKQLDTIRRNTEKAHKSNGLSRGATHILAASKTQTTDSIREAIALGINLFGENRVQEAYDKWPDIKNDHPNVQLHLIGPLQTNKTKQALELFDGIQTLDREKLAQSIVKLRESGFSLENKTLYVQINTGNEPQKAGIVPKEADAFISHCIKDLKLPVVGLMCIPPAEDYPAPHFALLYTTAKKHGLKELSMGMSSDYETAIRMGSTCIRIGTELFGKREGI